VVINIRGRGERRDLARREEGGKHEALRGCTSRKKGEGLRQKREPEKKEGFAREEPTKKEGGDPLATEVTSGRKTSGKCGMGPPKVKKRQ